MAPGLCDLGMGYPELGYVSIEEISGVRGPLGLPVERDLHFDPQGKTLQTFADTAHRNQRIVT